MKIKFKPAYWAVLLFVLAQAVALSIISRMGGFLESNNIYVPPQSAPEVISFWPPPATATSGAEAAVPFWKTLLRA